MTRSTPTIHGTTLLFPAVGQATSIVVGSAQWFEWLGKETTRIFSFQARDSSSYTARKERAGNRRGAWYWKAYRTYQRRLYRAYLGKSEELTLLQAPAGFGKTTLVTQWIAYRQAEVSQRCPEPVAWISLDSGDNDPVRFWSSVITACRTFHAHLGQTALAHLSQAFRSPFSSASLETALSFLYA